MGLNPRHTRLELNQQKRPLQLKGRTCLQFRAVQLAVRHTLAAIFAKVARKCARMITSRTVDVGTHGVVELGKRRNSWMQLRTFSIFVS